MIAVVVPQCIIEPSSNEIHRYTIRDLRVLPLARLKEPAPETG